MKSYLSILALAVLASACSKISSDQVDPSTIYGSMSIDRESSSISVSNTFYVGGSTGTVVTIDSPASVMINGGSANVSNDSLLNITSYTANLSTSVSNINVVYTDKNGFSYSNSVATPGDLWNTNVPATGSLSSGFNFTVNTHTHFSSEELTVVLTTFNSVSEYYTTLSNNVSTQNISIPGNAFQSISAGGAQLKTCRSSHPNAQSSYPKGTSITVQSCTPLTSITLTP